MHQWFRMIAAVLILAAPTRGLAQEDLIENFAATGLNCKVGDPRPGCNKVWKVPFETLAVCQADAKAESCAELFSALRSGAIVQAQQPGQ